MLSGIKVGKKKKKRTTTEAETDAPGAIAGPTAPVSASVATSTKDDNNAQVAALLRKKLSTPVVGTSGGPKTNNTMMLSSSNKELLLSEAVPLGKLEKDWTVQEMAAAEKLSSQNREEANILRHFKRKRRKTYVDSDDEESDQIKIALGGGGSSGDSNKVVHRETSRRQNLALTQNRQMQAALSKSWWWIESSRFEQHRLLARGMYVSLVWAPPFGRPASGKNDVPQHLFLVPNQPAMSFRVCDEETVWKELRQFQASLKRLYLSMKLDVVFAETVLENASNYWQTKMHVLAFPQHFSAQVPMYVRQALAEQEYEAHKLIRITPQKGLTRCVPPNFPYAYIQCTTEQGFVQVLETSPSKQFSANFWVDMVVGMLGLDAFHRQKTSAEEEAKQIKAFRREWPSFDFVTQVA